MHTGKVCIYIKYVHIQMFFKMCFKSKVKINYKQK